MANPDGFDFRALGDGTVQIKHAGRNATKLRGEQAQEFLTKIGTLDRSSAQHLMARLTGNYKRGNERQARKHPRNG